MPIKGLSEQIRFTRGGHIRLGTKNEARGYPEKSDHFIADFESPDVEKLFYQIYGDKPTEITIAFAAETQEEIFPQWYKCYGASTGLKCRGDGEVAHRADDKGNLHEVECPGPAECDFAAKNGSRGKPGCKQMASLQFFIKGLPGIQVFQINTTSFNSIKNINTGIHLLQSIRGGRRISGVWVDLLLVPQTAQAAGKSVQIYVMKLDIKASLDNLASIECAFETPRLLPEPDESRDELLVPTVEATPAQRTAWDELKEYCEAHGLDAKAEARKVVAKHRPENASPDWSYKSIMDSQVRRHILMIRFDIECAVRGVDSSQVITEMMAAHDCVDPDALPSVVIGEWISNPRVDAEAVEV